MGNWFGGGKSTTKQVKKTEPAQATVTDKDRAILDLKNARDRMKKFRNKLEKESADLQAKAKTLIAQKQKEKALLVLKIKKFKEKEANKVELQLLSVMEMIQNVEWEYNNLKVLQALQTGNEMLNKIHKQMSVDDVAAILEETNEAIEAENEINSMLAGQFNAADDEELAKELNSLEELWGIKQPEKAAATVDLPLPPTAPIIPKAPVEAETEEETKSSTRTAEAVPS